MFTHATMNIGAVTILDVEGAQASLVTGRGFEVSATYHPFGKNASEQIVDLCRDKNAAWC
jgi:hypothetical protein